MFASRLRPVFDVTGVTGGLQEIGHPGSTGHKIDTAGIHVTGEFHHDRSRPLIAEGDEDLLVPAGNGESETMRPKKGCGDQQKRRSPALLSLCDVEHDGPFASALFALFDDAP